MGETLPIANCQLEFLRIGRGRDKAVKIGNRQSEMGNGYTFPRFFYRK